VKRVGFDLLLFFKETFSGAWVVIAISAFACYAATYIKGYTFKTLIIQCAIHVVVYVVAVLVFGLNKSEKTALFLSTKKFGNLIGARWPT
jgi:hypothetical protein